MNEDEESKGEEDEQCEGEEQDFDEIENDYEEFMEGND